MSPGCSANEKFEFAKALKKSQKLKPRGDIAAIQQRNSQSKENLIECEEAQGTRIENTYDGFP